MRAIEIQKKWCIQIKDFKHKGFPLKETRRYITSQNSASTTQQEAQHQSPSKASCLASRVWCVVFHGVFHGQHDGGADGADGQSWHNWQMRKGHHAFEDEDVFWTISNLYRQYVECFEAIELQTTPGNVMKCVSFFISRLEIYCLRSETSRCSEVIFIYIYIHISCFWHLPSGTWQMCCKWTSITQNESLISLLWFQNGQRTQKRLSLLASYSLFSGHTSLKSMPKADSKVGIYTTWFQGNFRPLANCESKSGLSQFSRALS